MPDLTLDLRFLRYAMAAAERGSFRQAADVLGLSQSTLSRRIQLLEHRLGAPLFERNRKGVRTTLAGERFLQAAKIGADHLQRAANDMRASRHGDRGELRIGLFASLASGYLGDLLTEFRARFPDVILEISEDTSDAIIASLSKGLLDVGFLSGEPIVSGCNTERLWCERIYLALPGSHPLLARHSISWSDIKDEKFIVSLGGPGREIEDHILRRLTTIGFRPTIHVHKLGRENLMHLVARGFGLTLTTDSTLGTRFSDVTFRTIDGEDQLVSSSMIWPTNNANPSLKQLINVSSMLSTRLPQHRSAPTVIRDLDYESSGLSEAESQNITLLASSESSNEGT